MPQITPDSDMRNDWGAGRPAGATVYSADSSALFPPLPEPEPRRPPAGGPAGGFTQRPPDMGPPPFAWPDDCPTPSGSTVSHVASHAASSGDSGPEGQPPSGWDRQEWREGHAPDVPGSSGGGGYHPGPSGPWSPPPRRGTGAATAALVLGIVSLFLLLVCGVGVLTALVGLIVGIVALGRGTARGRAWTGIILSAITLLLAALFAAWLASTGVTRCLDETLYPTRADLEACLEERLGVPVTIG